MIQQALAHLVERKDLSRAQMSEVMGEILTGGASPAQVGAFLTALRLKGESVEEIVGAAEWVRGRLEPVLVAAPVFVDTCGTGGDGANTFNISTAAALVVAAAGVTVAKHGNRSVSSRCGSADVLTELGVNVAAPVEVVEKCIEELRIGFLFAPRHHPAFKAVAQLRKELGVRTLFNLLGPLANPARARHQVLGVYDPKWVPVLGRVLQALGSARAMVVHGEGLDEISVCGPTRVCELWDGEVRDWELFPEDLGLPRWPLSALAGGDAEHNARILRQVLDGEVGAPRDAVVANAAAALVIAGAERDLRAGVRRAEEVIDIGAAKRTLKALVERT